MSKLNVKEFIGKKYNKLTIIDFLPKQFVLAKCECGNEKKIKWYSVKYGTTKTCGCEQRSIRVIDRVGERYGRLVIRKMLANNKIEALCDCGVIKIFCKSGVVQGNSKSCGCLNRERITKHGLCGNDLYSVWEGMIQRCYNKNHKKYANYGGRGVIICDEWRNDFKPFYDWAIANGWEKGLKIDKDIKGKKLIYSPEFCSIVTHKQNLRCRYNNRIVTYNNESLCVAEWAEKLNMPYERLSARLKRGWPLDRALRPDNFKYKQLKKAI